MKEGSSKLFTFFIKLKFMSCLEDIEIWWYNVKSKEVKLDKFEPLGCKFVEFDVVTYNTSYQTWEPHSGNQNSIVGA